MQFVQSSIMLFQFIDVKSDCYLVSRPAWKTRTVSGLVSNFSPRNLFVFDDRGGDRNFSQNDVDVLRNSSVAFNAFSHQTSVQKQFFVICCWIPSLHRFDDYLSKTMDVGNRCVAWRFSVSICYAVISKSASKTSFRLRYTHHIS